MDERACKRVRVRYAVMLRRSKPWAQAYAQPAGVGGALRLRHMANKSRPMHQQLAMTVEPGPSQRVLEIGFGNGALLEILGQAKPALLAGVEVSDTAHRLASRRLETQREQPDLRVSDGTALPFDDDAFTAVCASNLVYFWEDPVAALGEIRRVLAPGGMVAFAYTDAPTSAGTPAQLEACCRQVDFTDTTTNQFWREGGSDYNITTAIG